MRAAEIRDAQYLEPMVEGRTIGAICVTEPVRTRERLRDTNAASNSTPATDEWVINGLKRYISNASVADVYIVYGISDRAARRKGA